MKFSFLVIITILLTMEVRSQQTIPNISGIVKDSVTGKSISSATATLYMGKDSLIINYGFTSGSGKFRFEFIPSDTTLYLVISHLGYKSFTFNFRVTKSEPEIALNSIVLSEASHSLNEVKIAGQKPPVFMRGDTLVVNPEAFKTKENAVVEDVLRKVPGIVVWADGKISVNGKYVTKLLVAGKSFFGGDPVVAIRNLPKESIDKIKIYEEKGLNQEVISDPQLIMDIQLRGGLNAGFFGKGGGGVGTNKRTEGNLAMNVFTPKNQVSIMAVTNNTNKEINDVRSMLRQTVYKPGGNDNTSYQSNFGMQGLNDFKAGGVNFERQWSKTVNSKLEYFRNDANNKTEKILNQITSLDNSEINKQIQESYQINRRNQFLKPFVSDLNPNYEFTLGTALEDQKVNENQTSQIYTDRHGVPVSNNFTTSNSEIGIKRINLNGEFIGKDKLSSTQKYTLRYNLFAEDRMLNEKLKTIFSATGLPGGSDINIDRNKLLSKNITNQSMSGDIDLNAMLKMRSRLRYKLQNTINHITQNSDQTVNKFSATSHSYTIKDNYLTNQSNYKIVQERPGVEISAGKVINGVRNRKALSIAALSEIQYINQENESQKAFQNLQRDYWAYLPSVRLQFNHTKEGNFNKTYQLKYSTYLDIPTIEQLAPLTDSTNQYYIAVGNPSLRKQFTNELSLGFQNYRKNNAASFGFEFRIGQTNHKLADSSLFDLAGRQTSYTVNANGSRYFTATLNFEESFKLLKNPMGFKVFPRINLASNPYYVNGQLNVSKNLGASLVGMLNYVQNDLLLYDLITNIVYNRNKLDGRSLRSAYLNTGANIQLSWPKHTTIVNSLGYTITTASKRKNIDYLAWNINLYYRLLKSEQLELKVTATDLLRQRTNVVRVIENNFVSNGTVNNLQNYFMLGLSYYPRYFGLNKEKK